MSVCIFDGWRLNFRPFYGWWLTPLRPSSISRKKKMKNVHLLKISLMVQMGAETGGPGLRRYKQRYVLMTQILLKHRPGSLTFRSKPILEAFIIWSHQSKPVLMSPHRSNRLMFGKEAFYIFFCLNILNQSHNFPNLNFCDVTLLFAIKFSQRKLPKGKKQIARRNGHARP